jgi:hypothetical protein
MDAKRCTSSTYTSWSTYVKIKVQATTFSFPTQMHIQSQNYVEAALTLQLHSDLHEWDLHTFVPAMEELGLPRQSHFHRKETLCLLILDYLGTCLYISLGAAC